MGFTFGGTLFSDNQSFEFPDDKSGTVALKQDINGGAKVYRALLSQTGTNAPVATVLENTLGNIVWTRDSAGTYFGTLTGAFLENKTFTPIFINNSGLSQVIYVSRLTDSIIQVVSSEGDDGPLNKHPNRNLSLPLMEIKKLTDKIK